MRVSSIEDKKEIVFFEIADDENNYCGWRYRRLTAALLLHKAGVQVKVFESVKELKPLGVGINLLPHSVTVLDELGLVPKLEQIGVSSKALLYYNKFGQKYWEEPRGIYAGYKVPQFSFIAVNFSNYFLKK